MKITVDMPRAREIKRDLIRGEREPLLVEADTAYLRALEAGADTTEIVARKQALRDAPAHASIAAAETPEALAAITLDSLL